MIERLPLEFKGTKDVSRYHFTQVYARKCSDGKFAYIYEQTEYIDDGQYYVAGYEVVKPKIVKKTKVEMIDGKKHVTALDDLKEVYPKSEEWGLNAFTCKTLNRAMQKIAVF